MSTGTQPKPRTIFEAFYASLGSKLSAQLFATIRQDTLLRPAHTLASIGAIGLATLVHLTTLLFAVLGAAILWNTFPNPIPTIAGLMFVLLAWHLRPQLGRLPSGIASPARFPTLYALVNRIAALYGAPAVDALVIDEQFNASFTKLGWRRKQLITIGLPLFTILTPQEQVAILAHEVAHGVNGDQGRHLFVGAAVRALSRWHQLLRPDSTWGQTRIPSIVGGLTFLATGLANTLMRGLSIIPWLWSYLLSHLLWQQSQRAEYLADALAARASGTDAMLGALEKLHYGTVVNRSVQILALNPTSQSLIPVLRQEVAALPSRELERIRRSETLEMARLDTTHPPTTYRIDMLRAHPVPQAAITLSEAEAAQLEQELSQVQANVQRDLIDQYRRNLYY